MEVMNTKDYGIPQNRERVYFVGTKEEFYWPEKVEMDDIELCRLGSKIKKFTTVYYRSFKYYN